MLRRKIHLSTPIRFKLSVLFLLPLISFVAPSVFGQTATLELNQSVEREIAAKEKHDYQINLAENQFVALTIDQRGIDVAVRLFNKTDKRALVQRDSILTIDGTERIDFVATSADEYRLEIEAKTKFSATGVYKITLSEKRPATEKERRLEEARFLHNEAVRLWNEGKYSEALPIAERSLMIRESESGAEDADVAASLANLALILADLGEAEKAISAHRRALTIREKKFGVEHPDVARTLHNLGLVYSANGNYEEAIRVYEKTIAIREKVLGADNADLATSLNNLGSIYRHLADYEKAEEFIRRGLEIKQKTLPPTSPSIAASYSNLASLFSDKGDADKALEYYKISLDIREKSLKPEHPDIARSLSFLASEYLNKGDYERAEAHYLRALGIFEKAFGQEHFRNATVLGSLAILHHRRGDDAKAEPLFRQTIAMMEKTLGRGHRDYATAVYNLADFYTNGGEYEKAEPLYRQALEAAEKTLGTQHPDVIVYLNGLARNYQAKGNAAQAVPLMARARALGERNAQLVLFTNSERQKLLFLDSISRETNQYISAHLNFAPEDKTALELALTTILERKGRVSDAMTFEFAALRNRFNKDDQVLLNKLKETTARLAHKILNASDEASGEYSKQLLELEERKEELEAEISRRSAEFRSQMQPATISAIQSGIPENAALVEFSVYRPFNPKAKTAEPLGEPHYAAYVVRRSGAVQWADLGAAKPIDAAIENFRQSLRDTQRKDVQTAARAVDLKIMQPVRRLIGDATQLLISPDGELNLIPFEALIDERDRYLIESYAFSYLTSGRDLLRMKTSRESKSKSLIVANPTFGESIATERTIKTSFKENNRRQEKSVTATRSLSDTYFAPLGGTAQEARLIKTLFPESAFLVGAQATETALKQTIAPRILHVATHGFFLEDAETISKGKSSQTRRGAAKSEIENPLLRSGLALAGANQRKSGDGDDGILTALEAANLNLWGTKLVVLSACDTGLGEVKNGEGVYGLRRALVLAGAESSVMSLWSVSDYVTRELMTNYYKNLKQGAGRGAALRSVKLEMLKRKEREHPFFWAGFIQSGEWANLDGKR